MSTFLAIVALVSTIILLLILPGAAANANGYHYHRPHYTQAGRNCIVTYANGSSRFLRDTQCPGN